MMRGGSLAWALALAVVTALVRVPCACAEAADLRSRARGRASTSAALSEHTSDLATPYAPLVRQHFYQQLAKPPGKALLWELLVPGGGNFYVGLYAPAASTLVLSLLGTSLWVAGALSNRPALLWSGVATFGAARIYGVVSAPVAAALLNAAFRRQLGISASY